MRRLIPVTAVLAALAAAQAAQAAFPGENGRIAFSTNASDGMYVTDPDGRVATNLGSGYEAAFSPDGERIVFVRLAATDCETPQTYEGCDWEHPVLTMNADGTDVQRITYGPGEDRQPAFSPDGERVVFVRGHHGSSEIFVTNADGTGVRQLTDGGSETAYHHPEFSPDGETIVFAQATHRPHATVSAIYAMDSDGGNRRRLTRSAAFERYWQPTFSPDGKRIAFDKSTGHVFTMNADGSNVAPLTEGASPSFSPDGERIAFTRYDDGYTDLYVMDVDSRDVIRLPRLYRQDSRRNPDWGPAAPERQPRQATCRGLQATIIGTEGEDVITGTGGPDVVAGLGSGDTVRSRQGDDVVCGGQGDDRFSAGQGDDILLGGPGADTLFGGKGFDRCFGGKGSDTARCERTRSA